MIASTKITLMNKVVARALDKKCLQMTYPHEPLVQIQNDFTELFLMILVISTKIIQTVLLYGAKGPPEL